MMCIAYSVHAVREDIGYKHVLMAITAPAFMPDLVYENVRSLARHLLIG